MGANLINESAYAINKAVKVLQAGGLVSLKTETVYGLACDPSNINSIKKLYKLKQRPFINPLIIHVSTFEMLKTISELNTVSEKIINNFWPGPLTLILPRKKNTNVHDCAVSGLDTIAVRMPNSDIFLKILNKIGKPLAAPSANQSGYISSTNAFHVLDSFKDKIDLIINSGQSEFGLESTIIDLSRNKIYIQRPGIIDTLELERKLSIKIHKPEASRIIKPNSPGQMLKHYAPNTPVKLNVKKPVEGEAFLAFGNNSSTHSPTLNLSQDGNLDEAAYNLFNFLRKLDKLNKASISVSPIPNKGIGKAINERLKRAAYK